MKGETQLVRIFLLEHGPKVRFAATLQETGLRRRGPWRIFPRHVCLATVWLCRRSCIPRLCERRLRAHIAWRRQLLDEQGTLIEIVSNRTGAVERAIAAPQLTSSRREERTAALFGSLLAVYGNNNNTVVYRTSDGTRLLAFFGRALAGDDRLGLIASTNRHQGLTVYDVADGKQRLSVTLDQNVLAARLFQSKNNFSYSQPPSMCTV